jgi:hypothetical protein
VAGKDLAGITLLGAPKVSARADKSGKSPAETKTLGTAVDDTGVRLTFAAPPVFDGPFSLWDPIRQKRDRTLLPLAGGMFGKGSVTVLISSRAMTGLEREPGGRPGLYRVTLGSGRTFKGTIGKRMLLGRSAGGEFEIPIRRLKKLSLPVRRTVYRTPSETRAEVHLLSGESLTFREPLFFYERKLLPQWQESGLSWTGGHTKPFLFVRFGGTAQRVSFAKLSRLETPTKPGGKFVFVSRDGGRLVLRADFDRHKAFENLMGTDQLHESAEAYALANLGLLGTLAPGVFVHVPWKAIRSVDLDGGGERGNSSAGVMSSTRSAKPSRTNP